jgi:uncharacterized LabA/DUF88 family protein
VRAVWVRNSGGLCHHWCNPSLRTPVTDNPIPPPVQGAPRLEIFVDGSNWNLALIREGLGVQVDLNLLATRLSRGFHFVKLRYYTSPLPNQASPAYRRQQQFFDELRRSRRIDLVLGRHEPRTDDSGSRYFVEKETDVNLAVDMVIGAWDERFDTAMLVAGDTDYVRAIQAVKSRGKRLIWCHLPGQRHTDQLAQICDQRKELDARFLRTCIKRSPPPR